MAHPPDHTSVPGLVRIERALVSVSDKTGLVPFARALVGYGVEIISTGGTAKSLADAGIAVTPVERITGFPEIMHGRVKTLHPTVHGGLLAVRDDPDHRRAMAEHAIRPIDLVCVNLYPFEKTVARPDVSRAEAVENIDIGGPSMVRSAAKNHAWVTVVTDPDQYVRVLDELRANDARTTPALRAELAARAFALTARYDAAIAGYLAPSAKTPASDASGFPGSLDLHYTKIADLRYGENPHQPAALYASRSLAAEEGPSVVAARQLHGKELSYNNIADAQAAVDLVDALSRGLNLPRDDRAAACVVKHTNPCGAAVAGSCRDAVDHAIAGDPVAAYGGILATTVEIDDSTAERLCASDVFFEVVIAPRVSAPALERLRARWANLRVLSVGGIAQPRPPSEQTEHTHLPGGLLVQRRDERLTAESELAHRAGPPMRAGDAELVRFLEIVGRALLSNAIVIGGAPPDAAGVLRMFGAGAGQMDRVNACRIAAAKAGALAAGAGVFSDAFFPFDDGPRVLVDAGVRLIVHPGGSKRDQDTFNLCAARAVTCVTTGLRHFRH